MKRQRYGRACGEFWWRVRLLSAWSAVVKHEPGVSVGLAALLAVGVAADSVREP